MITIFAGPMFSGKTTSLIDHAHRTGATFVWKPQRDTRDASDLVISHDGVRIEAQILEQVSQLIFQANDTIYIDEAQFLSESLAREVARLGRTRDIYLSMLDKDYLGNDFKNFTIFTSVTHRLVNRQARCEVCSQPASFSHRKVDSSELILCGSKESYEPRCSDHFPLLRLRGTVSQHP
jgi:thymidine kinase